MKIKYFLVFSFVVCFVSVTSCQKDFTVSEPETKIVSSLDSNYLDKIYYINNGDTNYMIKYFYDNLKRVIKMENINHLTATLTDIDSVLYYYNSNDTMPFKSKGIYNIRFTSSSHSIDTTYSYFFYLNNNRVRDSILNYSANPNLPYQKNIVSYNYVANKIFSKTIIYNSPNASSLGYVFSLDTLILDNDKNIISAKKFFPSQGLFNSTFTYDSHPNPFYKLSNHFALDIIPEVSDITEEQVPSKNNLLTANQDYNNYILDYTGRYTYGLNGYPKEINDSYSGTVLKYFFTYKAL